MTRIPHARAMKGQPPQLQAKRGGGGAALTLQTVTAKEGLTVDTLLGLSLVAMFMIRCLFELCALMLLLY